MASYAGYIASQLLFNLKTSAYLPGLLSRRANAWDIAPMESFFKTLKVERIYQTR
jgi:putative transposase